MYTPSPSAIPAPSREHLARPMGLGGLYVFAFFSGAGTAGAYLGLALMLLALCLDGRRAWPALRRAPVAWLLPVMAVYLTLHAALAAQALPATAEDQWDAALDWLSLWLFLPIGWWLAGNTRRVLLVLGAAYLGLIVGVLRRSDWSQWMAYFEAGTRSGLGYTFLALASLFGVALLGLVCLTPRFFSTGRAPWRFIAPALWILGVLFAGQVLLITQSRGVWLSVIGILAGLWLAQLIRHLRKSDRRRAGIDLLIALPILLVILSQSGWVAERIRQEGAALEQVLALNLERLPYSSIGNRIHMLSLGADAWLARPWLGWGPGTSAIRDLPKLLYQDAPPAGVRQIAHYTDVHNTYLEILVRLGLAGLILLALLAGLLVRYARTAHRAGRLPSDLYLFLCAAGIFLLLYWGYNFRLLNADGRFQFLLLAGLAFGCGRIQPEAAVAEKGYYSEAALSRTGVGGEHR